MARFQLCRKVLWIWCALVISVALTACIPFDKRPTPPVLYDLGTVSAPVQHLTQQTANENMVVIPEIRASGAIDSNFVIYRFVDLQEQELHSYVHARWTQPPAEMVRERAQQDLGASHLVLPAPELANRSSWILLLVLEDFSLHINASQQSAGVVQLRATLLHHNVVVGQKVFLTRQPSVSEDAPGAVKALSLATDQVLEDLSQWLDFWQAQNASETLTNSTQ